LVKDWFYKSLRLPKVNELYAKASRAEKISGFLITRQLIEKSCQILGK